MTIDKAALARERLRRPYRPDRVRLLFVGEAPPASGRFFYQADSGLYRAIRDTFVIARASPDGTDFLESFRALGCYLVDLCGVPVDRLDREQRHLARVDGEARLSRMIRQLRPEMMITVVRSIAPHVKRARQAAHWEGAHFELPYPGRWQHHRAVFQEALTGILLEQMAVREWFDLT